MTSKGQLLISMILAVATFAFPGAVLWWTKAHPSATWRAFPQSGGASAGVSILVDFFSTVESITKSE